MTSETPLILGFDTSGPYISALLLHGDAVLGDAHNDMARGQAEHLFPLLQDMLNAANVTWRDLSAIGVGVGPGNFTGIRISVSAARGLGLSLNIPTVGVSLLDAVALDQPGPTLSCLSAPRGSIYMQGNATAQNIPAQFLSLDDLPALLEPGLTCIGSAAADVAPRLNAVQAPARYAPGSAIARLTAQRWQSPQPRPAPLYLKTADAAPPRDPAPIILD
ncbi:tRNA (adenosine(37)-N6)-threonylcarbamoyltransferase complex dimerization subunit type 1 TsaB [Shimia abyssi]|uniref:tRNA threonylcarbamoyl adenosine modification protein YeaZ n=1 Tax=Shimia abyssi TaxID=1662395 RepID=A0A2P8FKI8_9RHOB|nr:tRNA (adenosine(37)-N6)-threonylcarbamoyltransferase complex dimerization subunit type 1 TsaB [Shimia abyssi]PSL22208.1 tRNA threonylcarbamoyl adenosine modification protein YeaZ [Shimia abyssi]